MYTTTDLHVIESRHTSASTDKGRDHVHRWAGYWLYVGIEQRNAYARNELYLPELIALIAKKKKNRSDFSVTQADSFFRATSVSR